MSALLLFIFVVLAVIPSIVALVTYAFFWYETANSPYGTELEKRYGGRLRRVIMGGIASGIVSSILTILLFPLGFVRQEDHGTTGGESAEPRIFLIHGLYHNGSAWTLLRGRLKAGGFHKLSTVSYSSLRQDFWRLVEKIDQHICASSDSEEGPVILIGHSLGGLLAKACASVGECRGRIAGVITLGSPHQGSKLAVLGIGPLAGGIVHGGPIPRELGSRLPAEGLPCYAVYSPIDNMVLPNEALRPMEPGWTCVETDPVSHVSMLYHRRTAEVVIQKVREIRQGS
ncbi:MAG: alpha/beta fold hydrolase [Syntrophobacteraceae bacterium]|nr:alpha/beta fold hydrolase [Syntrophobacteraceae bacterium]